MTLWCGAFARSLESRLSSAHRTCEPANLANCHIFQTTAESLIFSHFCPYWLFAALRRAAGPTAARPALVPAPAAATVAGTVC